MEEGVDGEMSGDDKRIKYGGEMDCEMRAGG